MKINKELMKGSTVILILSLLEEKPMYGYEMIKEIDKKSKGIFTFKEGTLYPILHSLEVEGMIESYWEESKESRKRKYYQITGQGRLHIKEKKEEWETFRSAVDQVIKGALVWE